jgi:hypothetical protein
MTDKILVVSHTGWYAYASIDPEYHNFDASRYLVDPLSAPLVGFPFSLYKTSLPYTKIIGKRLHPSSDEIEQIAHNTITDLQNDLEKMVSGAHQDAVLVQIARSIDGLKDNKGNKWIIMGQAQYVRFIRGGPVTKHDDSI